MSLVTMGSKTDHDFFRGSDERQMKQFNVLVYNQSGKTSLMLKSFIAYGSQNCGYLGPNSLPLDCGCQSLDSGV